MSDLTVAASERTFRELFAILRDSFSFAKSDSASFAGFTASYAVAAHLEGGTVDLRDDNTVSISELDIKWDKLEAGIGFDIPEVCIGGFCILPNPFGGCLIRAPRICAFSANPDIGIVLPLSGITSEVSVIASLVTKYRVDPARTAGVSDLEAEEREPAIPNKWQIFIDPKTLDIDPLDFADTVGDLLEAAVEKAILDLLPLPGWAKDLILAILGPIIDLIRAILDLPDDIGEWLSDLLGVSLGLLNSIAQFLADYFAEKNPIHEFEDPLPVLEEQAIALLTGGVLTLIPVKIPVRDLTVRVNTDEMILEANVGS